jgi:hypothetical protein
MSNTSNPITLEQITAIDEQLIQLLIKRNQLVNGTLHPVAVFRYYAMPKDLITADDLVRKMAELSVSFNEYHADLQKIIREGEQVEESSDKKDE